MVELGFEPKQYECFCSYTDLIPSMSVCHVSRQSMFTLGRKDYDSLTLDTYLIHEHTSPLFLEE